MRIAILTTFILISLLNPLALAKAYDEETGGPGMTVREILPSVTDSRIDRFSGNGWAHWVYLNPSVPQNNLLLVFIPGTGGRGHEAKAFCRLAANLGFHVVSLTYPSTISMSRFRGSADPDVFLKARENVIYGRVPFPRLGVNEPNSIHNRLLKLLQHLAATFPEEKWDQYLDKGGALVWRKLVLSGGSQGGGHAAMMAMQHEVARVTMFGSPKDFNIHFRKPAKWFSGPNATPLNRFFSFVHSADEGHGCSYPQQLENYQAMKLLPRYSVVNVDEVPSPYGHSRLLTSSRYQKHPHPSVIRDIIYRDVWKYMLQEQVD